MLHRGDTPSTGKPNKTKTRADELGGPATLVALASSGCAEYRRALEEAGTAIESLADVFQHRLAAYAAARRRHQNHDHSCINEGVLAP